jgi:hypothetical protein
MGNVTKRTKAIMTTVAIKMGFEVIQALVQRLIRWIKKS